MRIGGVELILILSRIFVGELRRDSVFSTERFPGRFFSSVSLSDDDVDVRVGVSSDFEVLGGRPRGRLERLSVLDLRIRIGLVL
jgi:hypothetical protein